MKRGLVSPNQPAYATVIYANRTEVGAELGPLIIQVVDTVGDEFDAGPPLSGYWVDVPDTTVPYQWYYDTVTDTAVDNTPAVCYATEDLYDGLDFLAPFESEVLFTPPTAPAPANTTDETPETASAGSTLYWYNNSWVTSYFDPNVYNTLPAAKTYLNEQTVLVAANAVNTESSIYSVAQLIQGDLSLLITKDYPTYSISAYQTFIDGEVVTRQAVVNSATLLGQLFTFNPEDLDTNPGPG
jgi:hypothetical protein